MIGLTVQVCTYSSESLWLTVVGPIQQHGSTHLYFICNFQMRDSKLGIQKQLFVPGEKS